MKAIRILTLILGVSAISLLLIALVLPDHARIERSVVINASPAQVFPHVNGMRAFHDWSPWAKIDPNTQYRFAGPEQGVGSRMDWSSDHVQVGDLWANREYLARFAPGQKLRPADVTKVILASTNRADAKEEALIPALG